LQAKIIRYMRTALPFRPIDSVQTLLPFENTVNDA
jgi:hypothetical protein